MRILWLKTELLHPVDKGGKIRTFHMLKELKRDHHVTYLTLDDGSARRRCALNTLPSIATKLICIPHQQRQKFSGGFYLELAQNLISRLPYAVVKYRSAEMQSQLAELAQRQSLRRCDL